MLKVLAYLADKSEFNYIAVSESGRLATRVQNPLAAVPEIQDFERFLKARLDANEPNTKTEGLAELIEDVQQYNETVSPFERLRYVENSTPALAHVLATTMAHFEMLPQMRKQQNSNTIIDMKFEEVTEDGK